MLLMFQAIITSDIIQFITIILIIMTRMRSNSLMDQISINSYAVEEQEEEKDMKYYRIKLIVLGASGVGKSTMLYQYTHQRNPKIEPTIGTDFVSKVEFLDNIQCHLQIWDTADYSSPSIPSSLYNGALGFIIVYDISKQKTFDPVYSIMNQLAEKGDRNKQIFLVGNKRYQEQEREREVKKEEVHNFAKNRRIVPKEINFHEFSEVEEVFRDITERIIEKVKKNLIKKQNVEREGLKSGRVLISGQGFQKRYNRCC